MALPDLAPIRHRLNRFSCLQVAPALSPDERAEMQADLAQFNEHSDYQTLGLCAESLAVAQPAMEAWLQALGITVSLDLPATAGPIYLKFNTLKGAWYLNSYTGPSRGMLITFHSSDPETAEVVGTYGPLPLDLYP